jgi:hypothetical protein
VLGNDYGSSSFEMRCGDAAAAAWLYCGVMGLGISIHSMTVGMGECGLTGLHIPLHLPHHFGETVNLVKAAGIGQNSQLSYPGPLRI